jgi:hypothetical protein
VQLVLLARLFALTFIVLAAWVFLPLRLLAASEEHTDEFQFFESKIRPVLIQYCYDCHSAETELSGELGVDSRQALLSGGQMGPAIQPGDRTASLLWQAISYQDPHLQMPPDGQLDQAIIQDIGRWIDQGAADPRQSSNSSSESDTTPSAIEASDHWAFRPVASADQFEIGFDLPYGEGVDYWIDRALDERQLGAAESAEPASLARRLYFDLTGLPPSPEELREFLQDPGLDRAERLVERLLASPRFGEAQARHWMDVVRYADSITLRGFILPEAWRYRDYLIEAFNEDRSFQEMIDEQIAGDLLSADTPQRKARQLVATTFLALGNTNLEQQDKTQLELDYLDEQLDVIGSSLLGMTIGCARCHDHKFDPIPTRDYYALGGILRSTSGLRHDNVSQWIELPLPLPEDREKHFQDLAEKQEKLKRQVSELKVQLGGNQKSGQRYLPISQLPGIVVDNRQAMPVGKWTSSQHTHPIVGEDYLHDGDEHKGKKSVTFEPAFIPPGEYEVRLAYQHGGNRASNVPVKVFSADGEHEIVVNQRAKPPEDQLWISLGHYRFEADGQAIVLISNRDTDGHVIADAVQFLPKESEVLSLASGSGQAEPTAASQQLQDDSQVREQVASLERQLQLVQKELDQKPKYLTVAESHQPTRMQVHIRGNAHRMGEQVPRGFLTALRIDDSSGEPDRLDLARWIGHPQNPLTARVYVNRVWLQLMGRGIVDTPNNLGTTGAAPTHPELLDWLAIRFVESGWSTKTLVREIVSSRAYQRSVDMHNERAQSFDPDNHYYWRGQMRRIPVESLRDAMLMVSGELDLAMGGPLIRQGTKTDYNYQHDSHRRSVYQPVFRNSLPPLFNAFDFADPSVSVGKRSRTTGAQQGLTLMNDPWVRDRARASAARVAFQAEEIGWEPAIEELYLACFGRLPTESERRICADFIPGEQPGDRSADLEQLVWALFASIDLRYLD